MKKKEIIKSSIDRIDSMAQNILNKSKTGFENAFVLLEKINLISSIKKIIDEKILMNSRILFRLNSSDDALFIMGNAIEIERILSNLIDNSAEALSGFQNGAIDVDCFLINGHVKLSISDNGPGLPENILKIAGNFRTTSKTGKTKSNGIGLLHAKRVVGRMNGEFDIKSSKSGVTISILFDAAF